MESMMNTSQEALLLQEYSLPIEATDNGYGCCHQTEEDAARQREFEAEMLVNA
ncbi:MAG: hypothetical protein LBT94_05255 [Prevotellaceae bacterium]|jgi:hypothetical protein|nr:hypothetical protein [Prevotellaceae bacterium]